MSDGSQNYELGVSGNACKHFPGHAGIEEEKYHVVTKLFSDTVMTMEGSAWGNVVPAPL